MTYSDKTLQCQDCGRDFTFTAGEQEFYAQRGLQNEPRRCPECRSARKHERGEGGRGSREMHSATCAACGAETQVPFVPRGDRPVYCSSCYQNVRGG
ncbi:MAG: zinc-binding protein [Chloroflexota bacterium]|nr:MAG: zinc-binding protein [Chloroflexota bacterium]